MNYLFSFIYLFCLVFTVNSQFIDSSSMDTLYLSKKKKISINGYLDSYFTYDFNQPKSRSIPYFVSAANHNHFSINLSYLDLKYTNTRFRARFIPGFGSYMKANYTNEKGFMKNIVEASVGICLSKKRNIWLEYGILSSPFTNETAISKDHFMYTRSLAPEYVPYYLTGIKASIPLTSKWNLYTYILNGWQQISDQNNTKSFATQLEYRPNVLNVLNWNTYVGDERSHLSPTFRMRYFSDFYWIYSPKKKWNIITCIYGGWQKFSNQKHAFWWQANVSGKWNFSKKQNLAGRIEYFYDPQNCMITNLLKNEKVSIFSAGICYNVNIQKHILFRVDARQFYTQKPMFTNQFSSHTNNTFVLTGNITVWF